MKKQIIKIIDQHPTLYEIFKFLIIGGLATVIDMLTMALVLYIYNPQLYNYNLINTVIGGQTPNSVIATIATGTGFIFGLIFNYTFSITFVFTRQSTKFAKTKKGFISFTLLSIIGFFIHTLGMLIGHGHLQINEWIIKISLTIIVLVFNYITRKKIIFKQKNNLSCN